MPDLVQDVAFDMTFTTKYILRLVASRLYTSEVKLSTVVLVSSRSIALVDENYYAGKFKH